MLHVDINYLGISMPPLQWYCWYMHLIPVAFPKALRWYGTPCNIFKDDRILKNDKNHGFKNFKIYNILPQNVFKKSHKRDKK